MTSPWKWVSAVKDDHDVGFSGVMAAIALARYVKASTGDAYPSIGLMGADLRVSTSTIRRGLRELERHGYLMRATRFSNHGQTSNVYQIRQPVPVDKPAKPKPKVSHRQGGPVRETGGGVSETGPGGCQGDTQNFIEVTNAANTETTPVDNVSPLFARAKFTEYAKQIGLPE